MTRALERVKATQTLGARSAFAKKVERQGAAKLRRDLEAVGRDAVRRAEAIVSAQLVDDRVPDRRKPGRHLQGSFQFEIVGTTFPLKIRLFSLANPAKVNALNSGARRHEIAAVNAEFLAFPRGNSSTSNLGAGVSGPISFSSSRGKSQIRQGYTRQGKGAYTRVPVVQHPGNKAYHILDRALRDAVDAALKGARG